VADLTDEKQTEATQTRTTRALYLLNACASIVIRATSESWLLNEICRTIFEKGGYKLVWAGYAEHDERKSVRPVAVAGDDGGYIQDAVLSWADDVERGRGPVGTAIRTGGLAIVRDTQTDPTFGPWRRSARERGYRSVLTLPLRAREDTFGQLSIYSGDTDAFDGNECQLLSQLADDMSYAIMALRDRSARDRLAAIVETAGEAIVAQDPAGRIISWNVAAQRIFGYTAEEIIGRPMELLVPQDMAGEATMLAGKLLHGEPVEFYETIRLAKDARRIPVSITFSVIRDTEGKVSALATLMRDDTPRKAAEKTFREQAALLDLARDAILVRDMDDRVLFWNRGAEETYGFPAKAAMGRKASELLQVEFVEPLEQIETKVHHDGHWRGELTQTAQDGRKVVVASSWSLERAADGKPIAILMINRDVTEQKQGEAELVQYRQNLEKLVAERTAELTLSGHALTAANQELGSFAYSVLHDLRAPLRAIDGFSQILLEEHADKLDAEGRRLLHVVCDSATRMGDLIEDILAFSRIGQHEMAVSDTDMAALVQQALADLAPAMAGRAIKVEVGPLPHVQGDAHMLQRIWMNLLENAIKFTGPKPNAVIEVGARAESGETVFFVRDNGVGFDMQYVGKLFGAFQRLHGPGQFPGSGIGLAIVKRIATRHGGRVWAEGVVGEGATFYFALPGKDGEHA
jgi:PAS domain S-box-containing protein